MVEYGNTITKVLNEWADAGVFAYLLQFLFIFAVIFGILSKTKVLGENKGVQATIALAVGLLALQFDYVSNFFATIFPYAGIGIAVLLVALILMGLLTDNKNTFKWVFFGIGALIFIVVLLYSLSDFSWLGGYGSYFSRELILGIVALLVVAGIITALIIGSKND